jgi:FkbM family methyltransferase
MAAAKVYILKLFRNHFGGKKRYQKMFNFARVLSIQGLNYGNGGSIEDSGEITLLKSLAKKYTESRTYIIFDVGANQGDYTSNLLNHIAINDLQVWCFEPLLNTFQKLQSKHASKSNVFLNNIGFSNQNDTIPLYIDKNISEISSLFPLERESGAAEKLSDYELVSIRKIDDFLAEKNIPYIDLLKLDIEGNELNALLGAGTAIQQGKIRSIQFEFGTCNIDSRTYFRDFWNLLSPRYNLYRILRDGLQPITHYSEYEEVFTTINYFAELK